MVDRLGKEFMRFLHLSIILRHSSNGAAVSDPVKKFMFIYSNQDSQVFSSYSICAQLNSEYRRLLDFDLTD